MIVPIVKLPEVKICFRSETTDSSESRIFYKFDHVDDWDEEDPDDDLDI